MFTLPILFFCFLDFIPQMLMTNFFLPSDITDFTVSSQTTDFLCSSFLTFSRYPVFSLMFFTTTAWEGICTILGHVFFKELNWIMSWYCIGHKSLESFQMYLLDCGRAFIVVVNFSIFAWKVVLSLQLSCYLEGCFYPFDRLLLLDVWAITYALGPMLQVGWYLSWHCMDGGNWNSGTVQWMSTYMEISNLYTVWVISTSRKASRSCTYFSIVECLAGLIELTYISSICTSS